MRTLPGPLSLSHYTVEVRIQLRKRRTLRTTVPTTRAHMTHIVVDAEELQNISDSDYFNRHHGARELPALQVGDQVWLPDRAVRWERR